MVKMSDQKCEGIKCRICWTENEYLDWNNLIPNHGDLTYKDCFYKYTQLECINEDSFSNMICHNCSNGLEFIDDFITRAIGKSFKLQEMFVGVENNKKVVMAPTADSASVLVEEIEIKEEEVYDEDQNFDVSENIFPQPRLDQKDKYTENTKENNSEAYQSNNFLSDEPKFFIIETESEKEITQKIPKNELAEETIDTTKLTLLVRQLRKYYIGLSNSSSKRNRRGHKNKSLIKNSKERNLAKSLDLKVSQLKSHDRNENIHKSEDSSKVFTNRMPETDLVKKSKANKTAENIFLCQYCSAEIKGWSQLHKHEAKHIKSEVRKRTETCSQCGVKFYNKTTLRAHEQTHDINREKRFKCEYCEKAFYNMGALNVHKRIHLGLMVKCQICSKEFFRNIELYKHMNSHSSNLINVGVKKRSRYFVRCKHCFKKILSASYKSHLAAHLNQPLVKCSICNKEYFNRESCRHHLRTIHKKKPETVNEYVVLLKTDRFTHLYIRQNADIVPDEE